MIEAKIIILTDKDLRPSNKVNIKDIMDFKGINMNQISNADLVVYKNKILKNRFGRLIE